MEKLQIAVWFVLLLLIFGGLAAKPLAQIVYKDAVDITVERKEIQPTRGDSEYLIYSTSGEVFEITDTYCYGRFDSSNVYFAMKEGHTYHCHVVGVRFPFLSWYRNILSFQEV